MIIEVPLGNLIAGMFVYTFAVIGLIWVLKLIVEEFFPLGREEMSG